MADPAEVATPPPPENGKTFGGLGNLRDLVKNMVKNEDAPTAAEYAVTLALIIVVCLAAITTLQQDADPARSKPAPPPEPEPAPPQE